MPISDKIAGWLVRMDRTTSTVETQFAGLDPVQLNWKLSPDVWSIAQVLDHMMAVNRSLMPIFETVLAGTYQAPFFTKLPGLASLLGPLILQSQDPANRKKTKTQALWQPSSSEIDGSIVVQFREHQTELKGLYRKLAAGVDADPVISSPAANFIVYRLSDAMELLIRHEERHLLQAAEVKQRIHPNVA